MVCEVLGHGGGHSDTWRPHTPLFQLNNVVATTQLEAESNPWAGCPPISDCQFRYHHGFP